MKKTPLSKNVEIFRWGPVPMRFFYASDWGGIWTKFPLVFKGESWPGGLLMSKGANMVWVNDHEEIRRHARSVFLKYIVITNLIK